MRLFAVLIIVFLFMGCAGDSPQSDYETNTFYIGQTPAPKRPKRANLDFFNKVCKQSGKGSEYDCYYTDE